MPEYKRYIVIDKFTGHYRFLSNCYPSNVILDGEVYDCVEKAYQAAKTLNKRERKLIKEAKSPGKARQIGETVELRKDWESIKFSIMEGLVRQKFADPLLKKKLLATEYVGLIETNYFGDTYWGIHNGEGGNRLGNLLTMIRDEFMVYCSPPTIAGIIIEVD